MRRRQFHIKYEPLTGGREIVDNIFIAAAKKFNLFDNTITSRVPHTIKSIVEREGFGFGFGARIVGDLIIVDYFPNKSPSVPLFSEISRFLLDELIKAFDTQVYEVDEGKFIPTH